MPAGLEIELKLGLPDEAAWQQIRERLGPGFARIQVNHFFDRADGALRAERIGVRLRSEADLRILTVKGDAPNGPDREITRRVELERPMSEASFEAALTHGLDLAPWRRSWSADIDAGQPWVTTAFLDRLARLTDLEILTPYAHFENRRETCPLTLTDDEGEMTIQIEVDRTTFPDGHVDFEIEVEAEAELSPSDASQGRSPNAPGRGDSIERIHRALSLWLSQEDGIRTFARPSKLARLHSHLLAD